MSEEGRQPHTQEPAEGAEENVEVPGAERPKVSGGSGNTEEVQKRRSEHPQEPAEGGEEEFEERGADRAGENR